MESRNSKKLWKNTQIQFNWNGFLPLEFLDNKNRKNLEINGDEIISIYGIENITPNKILKCSIKGTNSKSINLKCRIDTKKELDYYTAGGILNFVLKQIVSNAA